MKNENKNTYKKTLLLTSIITAIIITSGFGVAYAANTEHPGTLEVGDTVNNLASGAQSAAFGTNTHASGARSIAFGAYTTATGEQTTAFGTDTNAQSYTSFVLGRFNEISGTTNSWIPTDPLFVIGNGASVSSPSNAVTVLKNGNVGIGISAPTERLQVAGTIESISGGFKFPDGTTQTTASVGTQLDQADIETFGFVTGTHTIDTTLNQADIETFGFVTGTHTVDTNLWTQSGNDLSYTTGNVGIGTSSPNSALQVSGYIQLDLSSGIPPSTDCDGIDEIGRMKVDDSNSKFYVCADHKSKDISWKTVKLK